VKQQGVALLQEHERLAEILFTEKVPFETVRQVLAEAGIQDAVKADKNIRLLAGRGPGYEAFCLLLPHVLRELNEAADPDMALNNWERLVEVIRDRENHFTLLLTNLPVLGVLLKILGASQYLTDILVCKPSLFGEIIATGSWKKPADASELRMDLSGRLEGAPDYSGKLAALREFKQRQMLCTGTRDLCGAADIEETLRETTALADACLGAALEIAFDEVSRRYGTPTAANGSAGQATAVVFALGKLGGEELNYSSDIDLMFMYSKDGETLPPDGQAPINNHEFFSKFAEKCIDLLTRSTEQGKLFRVEIGRAHV